MGTYRRAIVAGLALVLSAAVPPRAARAGASEDAAALEAQKAASALAERMKSADDAEKKAAVAEAMKVQHPLVTAALSKALNDADEGIRSAALSALVARADEAGKKAAGTAVAARLERIAKKNEDYTERLKVIAALHDLAQPSTLRVLAAETGVDLSSEELTARMHAIANLPCKEAIEEIIQFRSSGQRRSKPADGPGRVDRGQIGKDAFEYAVGVQVGRDPDEMRKWWKDHEKGFDFAAAAERRAREGGKNRPADAKAPDKGTPPPKPK